MPFLSLTRPPFPGSYTAQTDRILPLRPLPPLCLSSFPSVPSLHSSIPRVAEASEMNGERREPDNSRDAAEWLGKQSQPAGNSHFRTHYIRLTLSSSSLSSVGSSIPSLSLRSENDMRVRNEMEMLRLERSIDFRFCLVSVVSRGHSVPTSYLLRSIATLSRLVSRLVTLRSVSRS